MISDYLSVTSDITPAKMSSDYTSESDVILRFGIGEMEGMKVYQNRPNPFTSYTEVDFDLPDASDVTIEMYDANGRLIYSQVQHYQAGSQTLILDDQFGQSTGIIFLKLSTTQWTDTQRLIRLE